MIDTVFFDFGGTLFYELRKIPEDETLTSGYLALRNRGLQRSFEDFKEIFWIPYHQLDMDLSKEGLEVSEAEFTRKILPELGMEPSDENVDAHLWGRFEPHKVNNQIFDDILPTLQKLRPGIKIGLISNAQPHGILWHLDEAGVLSFFDEIIISGAVGLAKPNPQIFELAAESICSDPEQCAMVGDSLRADAEGAEAVGMTGIVVERTGRLKQALPDRAVVTDMREILGMIQQPARIWC